MEFFRNILWNYSSNPADYLGRRPKKAESLEILFYRDVGRNASQNTTQKFPFTVKTAHNLKISDQHVITVTGKAFYDIGHAPADHSNRRKTPKDYAVWEILPVMALYVHQ